MKQIDQTRSFVLFVLFVNMSLGFTELGMWCNGVYRCGDVLVLIVGKL